jgi:uroporphyrinogen-III decarboxylase
MSTLTNIFNANKNARKVDQLTKSNNQLTAITAAASGITGISVIAGGLFTRRLNKKLKDALASNEAYDQRIDKLEKTIAELKNAAAPANTKADNSNNTNTSADSQAAAGKKDDKDTK